MGSLKSLIVAFAKNNRSLFSLGIISTLGTASATLSFGTLFKNIVDAQSTNLSTHTAILFAVTILFCILSFTRSYCTNMAAELFCQSIKSQIYSQILTSKPNISHENAIGILNSSFGQMRTILGTAFPFLIRSSCTMIGGFTMILIISPKLTLLTIGIIVISIVPIFIIKKYIKQNNAQYKEQIASTEGMIMETIFGIKIVKAYNAQNSEIDRMDMLHKAIIPYEKKRLMFRSFVISLCILGVISGICTAILQGMHDVKIGIISPGVMTSFVIYAIMIAIGLAGMSEHGAEFAQINTILNKINSFIATLTPETILDPQAIRTIDTIKVHPFTVKLDENKQIHIPNISVKKGQILILNGISGCGKSTLLEIIMGFRDVDTNLIRINDIELNSIAAPNIRNLTSYSQQNAVVFKRTIFENIAYANSATQDEVLQIMQDLNLYKFINNLDAQISQFDISGGEKQRISLARTMLKKAHLYIFDEPTNFLDEENAHKVVAQIYSISQDAICIIATHDNRVLHLLPSENTVLVNF